MITTGTRLGPYEIVSRLGAGGMGEVFRARDTRLQRDVAIKVLPPHLLHRADARERLRRESQAISSLSHPNICTLFDVGGEDGTSYLVMELLEGETLAAILARGALPKDVALRHAIEIARALDCAHRAGIVHRDLKPGNIIVTKAGVKLLDFGLARLAVAARSESADDATAVQGITAEGTIVGTLPYMAPEQLDRKPVDQRADIFAFGCILFEMFTGRRLFHQPTQVSLVAAIMNGQRADLAAVAVTGGAALERLVRRCLSVSPDERWQNAGDLAIELQWIAEEATPETRDAEPQRRRGARALLPWIVAAAAIVLAAFATIVARRSPEQPPAMRLELPLGTARVPMAHGSSPLAVSPDGRHLAFAGAHGDEQSLWIRSLVDGTVAPIPKSSGARDPFWSPDSTEIAFRARGKVWRSTLRGERVVMICDDGYGRRPAWGPDGTIVLVDDTGRGLLRVRAAGGTPEPVRIAPVDEASDVWWPTFVGPQRVAYGVFTAGKPGRLHLVDLQSGRDTDLGSIDSSIQVVDGVLLYVKEGALFAQRVDEKLTRTSDPVQIAPDVSYYLTMGTARFSASSNTIVYVGSATDARATWFDRSGNVVGTLGPEGTENPARISPDGKKAVLSVTDQRTGTDSLWIADIQRNSFARITSTRDGEYIPTWSPDGKWIAFASVKKTTVLSIVPAIGGAITDIAPLRGFNFPRDWIEQGIVVGDGPRLATVEPRPGAKPVPLLAVAAGAFARVSPDRRWVAYSSGASGRQEMYVAPVGRAEEAVQVSAGGGAHLAWNGNSRELYYSTETHSVYTVTMKSDQPLDFDPPRLLFTAPGGDWDGFEAARDGQRFLITRTMSGPPTRPFHVVTNWKQLLD